MVIAGAAEAEAEEADFLSVDDLVDLDDVFFDDDEVVVVGVEDDGDDEMVFDDFFFDFKSLFLSWICLSLVV